MVILELSNCFWFSFFWCDDLRAAYPEFKQVGKGEEMKQENYTEKRPVSF